MQAQSKRKAEERVRNNFFRVNMQQTRGRNQEQSEREKEKL